MTEVHVKKSWFSPVTARLYDWYDDANDLEMWQRLAAREGSPVLELCGFEIENVWGGYDQGPLTVDSGMIFAARQPIHSTQDAVRHAS